MNIDSDKIFYEILKELQELNKSKSQILKYKKENKIVINQMAQYLRDFQAIIDFQLKDVDKNTEMMRELKNEIIKLSALADPNICGLSRSGNGVSWVQSSEAEPVYDINKTNLIKYAENQSESNNTIIYNTAIYRTGYLQALGSSFAPINEGFPEYMSGAQKLKLVSSSPSDAPAGNGVQTVRIGGLNSAGLRLYEQIDLKGTTSVVTTNSFSQIDTVYSIATGTSGGAVGTVTVSGSNADNTAYAQIAANFNSWRSGRFFSDTKAVAYVDAWTFSGYTNAVRGQLRVDSTQSTLYALMTRASVIVNNQAVQLLFPVPIHSQKQGLVMVRGIAKADNTEIVTNFEMHFRAE